MARFYYQNQCVFKVDLRQIEENFDAALNEILEYLSQNLNVDRKLLTFQITEGEVHALRKEKEAC
jgi:hypothetical protein